jgi:hypothetical protein
MLNNTLAGKPECKWEDNIKPDLEEIIYDDI